MDLNIPEFMPQLIGGTGTEPKYGGCVMQVASWLADQSWVDDPHCVDDSLRSLAISVNDSVNSEERNRLLLAVPDLINTRYLWDGLTVDAERRIGGRLWAWVDDNWMWGDCPVEPGKYQDPEDMNPGLLADCIERAVALAHTSENAMGGGAVRDRCAVPYGECTREGKRVAILDTFTDSMDDLAEPKRHTHIRIVPTREAGSRELVDFFLAFVREWRSEFGVEATEITEAEWTSVRDAMTASA